jgi:arylsulfatase A-like enzyme
MQRGSRRIVPWVLAVTCACMPAPTARPDLIVLLVDTLRADRLGCYGSTRGLTPFLDTLAAKGHVVRHAYAQVPWTSPSVASLFTSRFQSQHGIVGFNSVLAESEITLAEALRNAGYATAGFSANGLIGPRLGYGQGFDTYEVSMPMPGTPPSTLRFSKRADAVVAEGLRWLDGLPRPLETRPPFFLYLHFMETHAPYAPPPALLDRVRAGQPPLDLEAVNAAAIEGTRASLAAARLADVIDAYDAEVMTIDAALARLFAELDRRGILEHATIVLTADHGEEFQEHGMFGHGRSLYEAVIRVPLIVVTPDGAGGRVVDGPVSLVDVAPTLLARAGVPIPDRFEGTSFAHLLEADGWLTAARRWWRDPAATLAEVPVLSERLQASSAAPGEAHSHERSVVLARRKLIVRRDGSRAFYALERDPDEHDGDGVGRAERVRLEAALDTLGVRAARDPAPRETRKPGEQRREALRGLGYVE